MRKAIPAAALLLVMTLTASHATPAATPEKTLTATGTISKLQAADRTLLVALTEGPETRFVWTAETKINGTLSQGAKVTIRYTELPDGQNLAHQISVGR